MLAVSCVPGDTGGAYDIREKPATHQARKPLSPWWYLIALIAGIAIGFIR
jgi:hypothetical protein